MRNWLLGLTLIGLGMVLFATSRRSPPVPPAAVLPPPQSTLQYKSYTLSQSVVHTLLIPAQSQFVVTPALSSEVATLEVFAQNRALNFDQPQTIATLNGGFFDPENHKSTSYVILQGKQRADPRLNQRLMQNPDLKPYLDRILNRTEFRRYLCGKTIRYDITRHSTLPPAGCQLVDALGGGPRLLPEVTAVPEGFLDYANGQVVRDPLRSTQADARTAIGVTRDGAVVWVMVAQKPELAGASGMSLQELADFIKTLGVEKAMNLDGGSSSSLYYQGKTFYGKVDSARNLVKRPVKSVLLVQEVRSK